MGPSEGGPSGAHAGSQGPRAWPVLAAAMAGQPHSQAVLGPTCCVAMQVAYFLKNLKHLIVKRLNNILPRFTYSSKYHDITNSGIFHSVLSKLHLNVLVFPSSHHDYDDFIRPVHFCPYIGMLSDSVGPDTYSRGFI